jgi:uncharacterized protein
MSALDTYTNKFPKAISLSWDDVENLLWELYTSLRTSGYDPDVVIAVARGGLIPARLLVDYLQKKYICTFQMGHFSGDASLTENPILIYPLPEVDLSQKKVLVVDDISDEGGTMGAVVQYLETKVGQIKTAVLVSKADSRYRADYCPKLMTEWRWVLFPWSMHEDLLAFTEKVLQLTGGATIEEIIRILQEGMHVEIATPDIEKVLFDMRSSGEISEHNKIWSLI